MRNLSKLQALCAAFTLLAATGTILPAQEATTIQSIPATPSDQTLMAPLSQPQIAFRILDDYATGQPEKDRKSKLGSGIVSTVLGGLMVVGGGLSLGYGLDPQQNGGNMGNAYTWGGIGVAAGGLVMGGIGIGLLASPAIDYRVKYRLVFDEPDPLVREALAASILKDLSDTAKTSRVVSGIVPIAITVVSVLTSCLVDNAQGKPWYDGISNPGWLGAYSGSLLAGILNLAIESEQERMYNKYLTARDAVYALPGQAR